MSENQSGNVKQKCNELMDILPCYRNKASTASRRETPLDDNNIAALS